MSVTPFGKYKNVKVVELDEPTHVLLQDGSADYREPDALTIEKFANTLPDRSRGYTITGTRVEDDLPVQWETAVCETTGAISTFKAADFIPTLRKCATPEIDARHQQNPTYQARQIQLNAYASRVARDASRYRTDGPYKIPVVVHVVYNTDAQKISVEQVQSQIDALNKDYRATNTNKGTVPPVWNGLVTDANVEFALATKTPAGAASNGVTYTQTNVLAFGSDDAVKSTATGGADPWSTQQYLNIWVCNLAGGLLGYAQFPGGPEATDGVVIRSTAFGTIGTATAPFNLGRTATHEIGHYFNLRHIWGDVLGCAGTDYVDDTPQAEAPNYGTPAFPHVTCNNGPNGDMFMNYMDYVNDSAMAMFTPGQVARMTATLTGPRASLTANTAVGSRSFAMLVDTMAAEGVSVWEGWAQ
ncbi:MAG TPA: zinc metalloprotease [Thermoanaerobaculia bacterium]